MSQQRQIRVAAAFAVVASLTLVAPVAVAQPTGPAFGSRDLAIDSLFDVVVDEVNGQILFSQGDGGTQLVVTDLEGNPLATVDELPGARGIHVAGSSLWVALHDDNAVAEIDLKTLDEVRRIPLGGAVCPNDVAVTGSLLVVGHDCSSADSGVGVIDLEDDNAWSNQTDGHWVGIHVESAPRASGTIVAARQGGSAIYTFDVASGTALPVDSITNGGGIRDIAFKPDGTSVVQASGLPHQNDEWSVPGLALVETYQSAAFPNAAEWSGDGTVLATGTDSFEEPEVWVYEPGRPTAAIKHELDRRLTNRGLAISHSGRWIWAVSESPDGGDYRLHVLPGIGWPRCAGRHPTHVGTSGADVITGTGGDDVVVALGGNDTITTGSGNDVICAGGGRDQIQPGAGDDVVRAGRGIDTVQYPDSSVGMGIDLASGVAISSAGEDKLVSVENAIGTAQRDTLIGDDGPNRLFAGGGEDEIYGGGGDDLLVAGSGADKVFAGDGADRVRGGPGNDVIEGGRGDDTLVGHGGRDLLIGDVGGDRLIGNRGADVLAGIGGADHINGGPGRDTISFAASPRSIRASLVTGKAFGEGADTFEKVEWMVGSAHADRLVGNGGPNLIESRGGDDIVRGRAGDDWLATGAGVDFAYGGIGTDVCIAAENADSCEDIRAGDAGHQLMSAWVDLDVRQKLLMPAVVKGPRPAW